nr:hypothetical protein [uncultured Mucilaginibacter sp.]
MKTLSTCLLYLLFAINGYCQPTKGKYLIITFEVINQPNHFDTRYFNYITPIDSIKKWKFEISPLMELVNSDYMFKRCIKGDTVNAFTSTTGNNYKERFSTINKLDSIIKKRRFKVQTIDKKWEDRLEKVNVYITPVIGDFCKCFHRHRLYSDGKPFSSGNIYGVIAADVYDESFKNTKAFNWAYRNDYSFIDFHQASEAISNYVYTKFK